VPAERGQRAPTVVRSVYVHAPFCVRRCLYCDFAVHVSRKGDLASWSDALAGELRAIDAEGLFALEESLDTLYVGGGTPSLLGGEAMEALAAVLGRRRLAAPDIEWTAEANPESLTPELASAWRRAGLNRLSIGIQTFNADALRWMGRLHGAEGADQAVDVARAAGFENLSVDLIFGLPGRLGRSWRQDLERVLAMDLPHVSLYGLTVEAGTPLGRAVREGKEKPIDEQRYGDEYLLAAELLVSAGYEHYEVSNFAKLGRRSRHNAVYWDGRPYLGLGNGAHSFADPVRRWNLRDWAAYQERACAGTLPEDDREAVDDDGRRLERLWLGLRAQEGVPLTSLNDRQRSVANAWSGRGWTRTSETALRLNAEGWLLLDELAVELDAALTG
jgi:oxygen-independent coproporphyrinogen-3 oxidase